MRHVVVRRTALLLGAVLLAATGLFAWLVSRPPAAAGPAPDAVPARGASLFQTHCASCHTLESVRPAVLGLPARRTEIEQFLADHGEASEAEDRLILDYLEAAAP